MKKWIRTVLTLVILAVVGGCGTKEEAPKEPIQLQAKADTYTARLTISPGIVGPNTFEVIITDDNSQAMTTGSVTLNFSMGDMEHGKSKQPLTLGSEGKWVAEGPHIMMSGTWEIQAVWKDDKEEFHTFAFSVPVSD